MLLYVLIFFFFNDTATTEIYTLSLHDALPISPIEERAGERLDGHPVAADVGHRVYGQYKEQDAFEIGRAHVWTPVTRPDLVCRLLLEKKKKEKYNIDSHNNE